MNFDWLIPKAQAILPKIAKQRDSKYKHFTFVVKASRILVTGWNDAGKTHPICAHYGYFNNAMHAEVHCFLRIPHNLRLHGVHLVNIQLRRGQRVAISAPCKKCQYFLFDQGFDSIWYSTDTPGLWEKAYLPEMLNV